LCVDDVTGSWMLKGNTVELDGQRYMRIKDVGMKLDIGDMKIYATNMINGSPELSEYYIYTRNTIKYREEKANHKL